MRWNTFCPNEPAVPLMIAVSMDNSFSTSILVSMALQVASKCSLCLLIYTAADRCRYYYAER